jgi:hypothetical protein
MTQFIESLYRLYYVDKIDNKKLNELLSSKKITKQEYDYIITAKKAT